MAIKAAKRASAATTDLRQISRPLQRQELFWIQGKKQELQIYSIPTKVLYFNIENGRYADKMIQLRADNPTADIDPREGKWRDEIWRMLKGEYPSTEKDREPFQTIREDILAKQQLRPGVVLSDGGVLDGNRRLAVLLDLEKSEKNPARFQYFDGVLLPSDVGPEDRWRIEAGLQIGRDEKLAYSPINELLKIREGLRLFGGTKSAIREIAKTLYGVPATEIAKDVLKVALIDEYLRYLGKPQAYNLITGQVERFEEAVNAVEAARNQQWRPERVGQLKRTLFALIRDEAMKNWDMREIWRAMGATGKGKSSRYKNEKALAGLLTLGSDAKGLQTALSASGKVSPRAATHKSAAEQFKDQMLSLRAASEPLRLAKRARGDLETLEESLRNSLGKKRSRESQDHVDSLPAILLAVEKAAKGCTALAKQLVSSKATRT